MGRAGASDLRDVISLLAQRKYLSVMIEAGSKMNWAALEAGVVDKVFLYYAPKILGGLQSLPVAGGSGRRAGWTRSAGAHQLHPIPPDEFAVEAYIRKDV